MNSVVRSHVVLLIVWGIFSASAWSQVPQLINYQGLLIDASTGQPVPDGTHNISFSIYDTPTGGSAIWTESQSVQTKNGLYSVTLGSTTPLTPDILSGTEKYLGIKVGSDPEMTPRKRIVSVAYALMSEEADKLDGKHAAEFADASHNHDDRYYTETELNTSDGTPPNQDSNRMSWDNLKDVPGGFADGVDNVGAGGGGWVDDGTVVRLETSTDSVGIGTTSPNSKLDVAGNIAYSGELTKLDVAVNDVATVRSYDFLFGHPDRHGDPGLALTDGGDRLVVNFNGDWPYTALGATAVVDPHSENAGLLEHGLAFGGGGSGEGIASRRTTGANQFGLDFYTDGNSRLSIANSGNVGIGTTSPSDETKLHIQAVSDDFGVLVDGEGTSGSEIGLHSASSKYASLAKNAYFASGAWQRFDASSGAYLQEVQPGGDVLFRTIGAGANPISWTNALTIKTDGTVKIAGASADEWTPAIYGRNEGAGDGVYGWSQNRHGTFGVTYSTNYQHAGVYGLNNGGGPGVYGEATAIDGKGIYGKATTSGGIGVCGVTSSSEGAGVLAQNTGGGPALVAVGNVEITDQNGVTVMELGEGLDYAEGFDVSDEARIVPGTVLIIDPNSPGQLAVSRTPYDTKVAGIVAGAKGLGSGVRLGPGQFDYDVALAGRVYCNVDATEAAVEPGDLLTTSSTPGYAMKATDYARAQGTILGKAMERLEKGTKGQVLVLVTLQ
jgi:hypothetical protein